MRKVYISGHIGANVLPNRRLINLIKNSSNRFYSPIIKYGPQSEAMDHFISEAELIESPRIENLIAPRNMLIVEKQKIHNHDFSTSSTMAFLNMIGMGFYFKALMDIDSYQVPFSLGYNNLTNPESERGNPRKIHDARSRIINYRHSR